VFRIGRYSVLVSFLMFCIACVARDVENGAAQVLVNVYDDAGIPVNVLLRAEQSAGRIFRIAGLQVIWRDCAAVPQNPAREQGCSETRESSLSIRVVRHSLTLTDSVFGVSFLDEHGSGVYGDIFFDNAQRMSEAAHVSVGDVLGHVIAHELGHLLLGRDAHSEIGIMRPHWAKEELKSLAMGRLLFTNEQGRRISQKLRYGSMLAQESGTPKFELVPGLR
jgi:hypothetical protein